MDCFNLSGQVAVIIGSSGGLGQVISKGMAEAGVKTVLVGRNKEANEKLAEAIRKNGGEVMVSVTDIVNQDQLVKLREDTLKRFGKVDILINCAGMTIKKPFIEYEEEEWDQVQAVNLKGVYLSCKVFAEAMIKQKRGKIINFTSLGSFVGIKTSAAYCAAKGGLLQLTKTLAMELSPYGINVNSVTPGVLDTPLATGIKNNPEAFARLMSHLPLGRLGRPEEIVGPVLFLASPASDYVNGISLPVDGGFLASGI